MKNLLFILAFLGMSFTSHSQVLLTLIFGDKLNQDGIEFGLDAGVNLSTLNGFETADYKASWNLGFSFDIRLKNNWSLSTGTRVKNTMETGGLTEQDMFSLGYVFSTPQLGNDYRQRMGQIQVPALIRWRFTDHFFVEAGGSAALNMSAHVAKYHEDGNVQVLETYDNLDDVRRIEFGVTGGVGYDFSKGKGLVAGLRYYESLSNLYLNYNPYNWRMLDFFVQFPIGLEKNEQTEPVPAE